MKRGRIFGVRFHFLGFFLVFLTFFSPIFLSGCDVCTPGGESGKDFGKEETYVRVVSLTPAITEMIYALGRSDRLIGVSRFCRFPPEAQEKMLVGGYYDVNRELLMKLSPDHVFLPVGENDVRASLEAVGLKTCALDLRTVESVYASLLSLGKMLDAEREAETLIAEMKSRMETLRQNAEKNFSQRKKVLFVVGRNYDARLPEDVYITGNDRFCNALLEIAGGENVYTGKTPFPKISLEGILLMNPDIIVESVPEALCREFTEAEIVRAWEKVNVKAMRNGEIYLMDDSPPLIPSVSMTGWAEKLQRKWMRADEKKGE